MDREKIQELDTRIMEVIEMIAEGMDRGYEDKYVEALYIAKDGLEKLEKIKQIVAQWNDRKDADAWAYREIKEVLE